MASCNCSARYMMVGAAHAASCAIHDKANRVTATECNEAMRDLGEKFGKRVDEMLAASFDFDKHSRTPLSEYTDDDLYIELTTRGTERFVVCTRQFYDAMIAAKTPAMNTVKWHGEIRAKKPSPPRDKFYVSDPETYHSDYD